MGESGFALFRLFLGSYSKYTYTPFLIIIRAEQPAQTKKIPCIHLSDIPNQGLLLAIATFCFSQKAKCRLRRFRQCHWQNRFIFSLACHVKCNIPQLILLISYLRMHIHLHTLFTVFFSLRYFAVMQIISKEKRNSTQQQNCIYVL